MSLIQKLKKAIPDRSPIRLGWHYAKAFVAALLNGFPAQKLTVVGITGTDGKTTTVGMVTHILLKSGKKVGAASTAFFQVNEKVEWNATQKTSVSPFILQKFLKRLVSEGCEYAVIEASSHGLVQGRLRHIPIKVAGITNMSPEHLDYHGTMEQYRKDKAKLFQMLRGKGTKVLNAGDGSFEVMREISSKETITHGKEGNDLWVSDVEAQPRQTSATLHTALGGEIQITLNIPGAFHLENALCAIGCTTALGIPLEVSLRALESFAGAPGRMEPIDEGQSFKVFVDFTVTPAAYERTLTSLRNMMGEEGRILVLCGSCGDRMREKRPEVGRIVSELADVAVVSNEDPYTEDPLKIIEEVWSGVQMDSIDAHKIPDRREAIEFLLREARPNDAVILCAKGADTTMWVADGQVPWNEREVVREMLRGMQKV